MSYNEKISFPVVLKTKNQGSKNNTIFTIQDNEKTKVSANPNKNIVVALDKPISSKFIKNSIKSEDDYKENLDFLINQYSACHYYFDKIYDYSDEKDSNNDFYKFYYDNFKKMVFESLNGKSGSFMLIGSSDIQGKYDFLFNDTQGIVNYVINEIINLIEHKNSENNKEEIKSRLKISFLMHVNDIIYDLIEQNNEKSKKDKYCFIELKNLDDFLNLLPKILSQRKKIANSLGKEEDHNDMIIKITIDNSNGSTGSIFISDIASVEYGLYEKGEEGIFNRYVYENYNNIANKLVKVCNSKYSNFEENNFCNLISESISSTSSKIVLCSYIVSNLYPNKNNIKCLNFVSWLINNINEKSRVVDIELDSYNNQERLINTNDYNNNDNKNYNSFKWQGNNEVNNQYIDLNYNYGEFDYQDNQNHILNVKNNEKSSFNENDNRNNMKINNQNLDFHPNDNLVDYKIEKLKDKKEKLKIKLNDNDDNLKDMKVNKIKNNLKKIKTDDENLSNKKTTINSTSIKTIDQSANEELNILKFKFDQVIQENLMLRNENIILREDVSRLNEIGNNYETNMEILKNRQ